MHVSTIARVYNHWKCIVYKVKGHNFLSVSIVVFCPRTIYFKEFYGTFDTNMFFNYF